MPVVGELVHLEDVLSALDSMEGAWQRHLSYPPWSQSTWDALENRCLEVMTERELCLYEIYTRFTKSLRIITIIMNGLFREDSTEMEVDEDLWQVRILVSFKYSAESEMFGTFDLINNRLNFNRREWDSSRLWERVKQFEVTKFEATTTRLELPSPTPAHLGYISGASDSESEASSGLDSDSTSSDNSDATITDQETSRSPPDPQRCRCCEYCPNESTHTLCPFANLNDEEREKIMTSFERNRSPDNQARMDRLREEKTVYRICVNLMERLKGDLDYVEFEGYLSSRLQFLREEDEQR